MLGIQWYAINLHDLMIALIYLRIQLYAVHHVGTSTVHRQFSGGFRPTQIIGSTLDIDVSGLGRSGLWTYSKIQSYAMHVFKNSNVTL